MPSNIKAPSNFRSLIDDFVTDLINTYPEHTSVLKRWNNPDVSDKELDILFLYKSKIYPQRFFDILYQNEEIFEENNDIDTKFFPKMDFKLLFNNKDISDNTKKAMWKYLQLILFSITGEIKDKTEFGDTMNIFEGIDEKELQEKLSDTMTSITDFFSNIDDKVSDLSLNNIDEMFNNENNEETDKEELKKEFKEKMENMKEDLKNKMKDRMKDLPNIANIQEHLTSLFDGKIGQLAKEMAEEIADDFKDILGEGENINNTQDVLKNLMKDPKKISGLMKTVGSKLESKMKSGEVSKEELVKEAGGLLSKMKEMGGSSEFNTLFKNLTKNMGGLGKNARIDKNALKRMTEREAKINKMKERGEKRKEDKIKELEKIKLEQEKQLKIQQEFIQKYKSEHGENNSNEDFIHPELLKELEDELVSTDKNPSKKKKKKKTKK